MFFYSNDQLKDKYKLKRLLVHMTPSKKLSKIRFYLENERIIIGEVLKFTISKIMATIVLYM